MNFLYHYRYKLMIDNLEKKTNIMPQNWKTYKLGDLGSIARGKSKHRPRDASHLYGGEYPFIQTGDVKAANHRLNKHTQTYSKVGLAQSKLWPKNTMCITIAANIAETALLDYPACFPDSIIGFVANESLCDIEFVEYLMQYFKKQIQSHSIGSVQDNINLGTFERVEFKVPPIKEQIAIASILSALDDKIEINLQMNKTLEDMAMALYKHWFVDFGPFQNGEFYDVELFGKNTLVQIPTNFEICCIKNSILRLKSNNKYDQKNVLTQGKVRVFDQSSSRILGYHNNIPDFISDFGNPTLIFGDHTCRMEIICEDFSVGPNLIPFRSKEPDNTYVMYLGLKEKVSINDYKRHWSELMLHQIALPKDKNIIIDFNSKIKENFSLITKNEFENQTLTTLRETLLPKLISGEVRVKDAEKLITAAL